MAYFYVIIGAGRQGTAIAYDLAKNCDAIKIALLDSNQAAGEKAVHRLKSLFPNKSCEFASGMVDAGRPEEIEPALLDADVGISAIPYWFNPALTKTAITAGVSFCDLGGNTSIVREQLKMHELAKTAGVAIVPDCGLAPGLGNLLAACGIAAIDNPEHVNIRCGGLPQENISPLGYKLLFNIEGLINEYSGNAEFLRDGVITEVPVLSELEVIEFDWPVGKCEAAATSGGTSTAPVSYFGKLKTYDYKTVRYPGHFSVMKSLFELGWFEHEMNLPDGSSIRPRETTIKLLEKKLAYPEIKDLTVLRVTVSGTDKSKPVTLQYDLMDLYDDETGFTAMERTTGFPAAIVAHMLARKIVEPGAKPLELAIPPQQFYDELPKHDIKVTLTTI